MENQSKNGNIIAIITMMFLYAMISFVTNLAAPIGVIWKNVFADSGSANMIGNNNVADALLNEAYQEDESGVVAYYVVKDSDANVLFFFSLKCGLLFDEFIEGEKLTTYSNSTGK